MSRWSHPLPLRRFHAWWWSMMPRSWKLWRCFGKTSGESHHGWRGFHSTDLCSWWCWNWHFATIGYGAWISCSSSCPPSSQKFGPSSKRSAAEVAWRQTSEWEGQRSNPISALPPLPKLRHQEGCVPCLSWTYWEFQPSGSSWCNVDWTWQEEICGNSFYG